MEKLSSTTVRFGTVPVPNVLRPSNTTGDWKQHIRVNFATPFGAPIPGRPKDVKQEISVVLTPRCQVPIVGVVEQVDSTGFSFAIRNADPNQDANGISVDWLAVLGVTDATPSPYDVRLSILQCKTFSGFLDGEPLWPRIWFSTPMVPNVPGTPPVILLTANNLDVPSDKNPAVVGHPGPLVFLANLVKDNIVDPTLANGFGARGVNVDTVGGQTGFYAAALVPTGQRPNVAPPPNSALSLWCDHGSEKHVDSFCLVSDPLFGTPFPVSAGGRSGDWRILDVYFDRPFSTPPIVLATARGHTPVLPIARNVTTHGFTMALRNTDSVSGHAAFFWVAIGCADGCG